jgi:glycosyltransferase involved in cell wall biosynthesis
MRVILMMVTKDEASRYLSAMLEWNEQFVDEVVVYDDCSQDDTPLIVEQRGHNVITRGSGVPTFIANEGMFRQAAWTWMESVAKPENADWILTLDADEFLVLNSGDLMAEIALAEEHAADAVACRIPEIFAASGDTLYRRVDGWWDQITGTRLVRWDPTKRFAHKAMASGSVPEPIGDTYMSYNMNILHTGYLDQGDAKTKYDRYRSLPGHNMAHVKSILAPGRLEAWEGPVPFVQSP